MNGHEEEQGNNGKNEKHGDVEVAVVTTGGVYPEEGYIDVPPHQKVRLFIAKAAHELGIMDFNGWIASVDGKEMNLENNYEENGLNGKVEIDFGPREGGGGNA